MLRVVGGFTSLWHVSMEVEIGGAERKEDEVSRMMYPNLNIVSFSSRRLSPSAARAPAQRSASACKQSLVSLSCSQATLSLAYRLDQNPHNILRRRHAGFSSHVARCSTVHRGSLHSSLAPLSVADSKVRPQLPPRTNLKFYPLNLPFASILDHLFITPKAGQNPKESKPV